MATAAWVHEGSSAYERLQATVEAAVRILADHLPAVTLLLRVRGNSPLEQSALERRRQIDDRLTTIVREAIEAGELRTEIDPEVVSRLVFGLVNSLVDWYRPSGPLPPSVLAGAVSTALFQGLARR